MHVNIYRQNKVPIYKYIYIYVYIYIHIYIYKGGGVVSSVLYLFCLQQQKAGLAMVMLLKGDSSRDN